MLATLEALGVPTSPTTLLVAGAVATAATLAVRRSSGTAVRQEDKKGVVARKIHNPASTLPILGNLVDMARNTPRFHDWLADESIAFNGEPWRMQLLIQADQIMLSSADAIEEVLVTQFEVFPKDTGQIEILETMFGRGLLASDGERWRRQRKTAAKFFSAKVLRSFLKTSVNKGVNRMTDVLNTAASKGGSVDLKEMFHNFTLDTFVEIALGVDLNCVGSEKRHAFHASLDIVSPLTSLRFRRPAWYWKLERWLGVGREGEMTRTMDSIYEWLNGVVQKSMDASISRATYGTDPLYRQAAQDDVLCCDIFIKKGENVAMSTYSMGRLTSLWGPDAAEFKPERWIDENTGKIKQAPATKFLSFSTGPRACIGMNLAMMELRVALANLLHRFRFDVDYEANAGEYDVSPTFVMKNPLTAHPSPTRNPPVCNAA